MIYLAYAHPYPDRSRANRALLDSVRELVGSGVRDLYSLYPGFDLDVEREQKLLLDAHVIVWQHPMYWYGVPPLLKLWFDKVLSHGFAYGDGGTNLAGKLCQWVVTTGGTPAAFQPDGMHAHPFGDFEKPIAQTARFCGMLWQPPLVVHAAHRIAASALEDAALGYRTRLAELSRTSQEAAHG